MTDPTPVTQLEYADRSHEPLLSAIRFASAVAGVYAAVGMACYLWAVALLAYQQFVRPSASGRVAFATWPSLLGAIPECVGMVMILLGANLSVRLIPMGRKLLLMGSIGCVICAAIFDVVSVVSMHRFYAPSTNYPFLVYYFGITFLSWARNCVVPMAVWLFFRRRAVRDAMQTV